MKISLSGTQSTGKTTLLNELTPYLNGSNYLIIKEVVRGLVKSNKIKINKEMSHEDQMLVLETHYKNCLSYDNFVTDRGVLDAFAYAVYSYLDGRFTYKEHMEQKELFLHTVNMYDYHVYLPPHILLVDDGVRSTDNKYREDVNRIFLDLYKTHNIKPIILIDIDLRIRTEKILGLINLNKK